MVVVTGGTEVIIMNVYYNFCKYICINIVIDAVHHSVLRYDVIKSFSLNIMVYCCLYTV